MKLKTTEVDGVTYAIVSNGHPVYESEGKDVPFDAPHAMGKIADLQRSEKAVRLKAEEHAEKLKAFEGIEDPEKALKALETVANLDSKDLLTADKVDEIKAAAIKAGDEKLAAAIKAKDAEILTERQKTGKLSTQLNDALIGGNFDRSKYVQESMAIPAEFVRARFGHHFDVDEDGKVVAKDASGNPVYSRIKPGDLADFGEAIEILVDQHPDKDSILKGNGNSGSGADHGGHGSPVKSMSREEFNKLPAAERAAKMTQKGFRLT